MPESTRPPFELAQAYDRAGQPAQAAETQRRFLSLRYLSSRVSALQKRCSVNPTVFDYPFELGMIELRRGDYRRAYVCLHKAEALRPRDRRVAAALEDLCMTAGPARMTRRSRIGSPASRRKPGPWAPARRRCWIGSSRPAPASRCCS